ncbi:MAG: hypothetical protein AVDCRST_MAG88-1138, partial [uncultured Thermomicrobiales bacterium]
APAYRFWLPDRRLCLLARAGGAARARSRARCGGRRSVRADPDRGNPGRDRAAGRVARLGRGDGRRPRRPAGAGYAARRTQAGAGPSRRQHPDRPPFSGVGRAARDGGDRRVVSWPGSGRHRERASCGNVRDRDRRGRHPRDRGDARVRLGIAAGVRRGGGTARGDRAGGGAGDHPRTSPRPGRRHRRGGAHGAGRPRRVFTADRPCRVAPRRDHQPALHLV